MSSRSSAHSPGPTPPRASSVWFGDWRGSWGCWPTVWCTEKRVCCRWGSTSSLVQSSTSSAVRQWRTQLCMKQKSSFEAQPKSDSAPPSAIQSATLSRSGGGWGPGGGEAHSPLPSMVVGEGERSSGHRKSEVQYLTNEFVEKNCKNFLKIYPQRVSAGWRRGRCRFCCSRVQQHNPLVPSTSSVDLHGRTGGHSNGIWMRFIPRRQL